MVLPPWRQRLQNLSEQDLWFLVTTCADRRTDHDHVAKLVRDKPDLLAIMLEDEKLYRRLTREEEAFLKISPYLLFSILLRQASRELAGQSFVVEESGAERIPVFAADRLRRLLEQEETRDYLAEMLSSFARTETATVYFRRRGAWYRHHFSDLDLDDLATLADWVEEEFRFPFYKRSADVALFIPGIFPEHTCPRDKTPRARRKGRSLEDYEQAGQHFYRLAARHPAADATGYAGVLQEIADRFADARTLLNVLSRRYFGTQRFRWFLSPA